MWIWSARAGAGSRLGNVGEVLGARNWVARSIRSTWHDTPSIQGGSGFGVYAISWWR